LDPSSGTASLVEIVRVFGKLKKDRSNFKIYYHRLEFFLKFCNVFVNFPPDWRPRRTIVFCSWGAEEYGLIGSYEWMEQHFKVLSQRAVAYLNVDVAVGGFILFMSNYISRCIIIYNFNQVIRLYTERLFHSCDSC